MSLRTRLILLFTVLSLGATALFGWLTYSVSRASLRSAALRAVGTSAQERTEALRRRLLARVERAEAVLETARVMCAPAAAGAAGPGACLRAFAIYRGIEGFTAAAVTRPGAPPVLLGPGAAGLLAVPPFAPGQIARFARDASGRPYFVVRARSRGGEAELVLRFDDLRPIQELFQNRTGLGASGETFLADERGYFITAPRHPGHAGRSHPIDARPMQHCLAGWNAAMLSPDYGGVEVIHAFRHLDFLGGGCVMAHITQAEAFAPARALGRRILWLGLGVVLAFAVASILLARTVSGPMLRLADAARSLERGELDHPIPVEGPAEVRALARALASMARSIRDRTRALEEANRVKSDFLAVMSHELRTPLNAIGGFADLLDMGIHGPVTDAQRQAIGRIQHAQRHLLGLINGILNFAKLEAGRVEVHLAELPVAPLLADLEALLRPQAEERGIELRCAEGDPRAAVRADREKVEQIVLNLLSNAVKFTPPGGRVEVGWHARGPEVELYVRDTGQGIDPERLASIFEPFVQVNPELTRTAHGTGLGLSISRELARLMDGDVTVESTPGRGSTFTLRLPAATPAEGSARGAGTEERDRARPTAQGVEPG